MLRSNFDSFRLRLVKCHKWTRSSSKKSSNKIFCDIYHRCICFLVWSSSKVWSCFFAKLQCFLNLGPVNNLFFEACSKPFFFLTCSIFKLLLLDSFCIQTIQTLVRIHSNRLSMDKSRFDSSFFLILNQCCIFIKIFLLSIFFPYSNWNFLEYGIRNSKARHCCPSICLDSVIDPCFQGFFLHFSSHCLVCCSF